MKGRRLAFWAVLAAGVYVSIEAVGWLGLSLASPGGFAAARAERREILERPVAPSEARRKATPGATANVVLHPYLGYVLDSRADNVNAYGFWGADGPFFDGPQDVTIGITGGSVSQRFRSDSGDLLAKELRRLPRFADKDLHVVSLGVWGYKQPQQLATVSHLLALGLRLDVLINIDGFNEVANALNIDHYERGLLAPSYPSPFPWFPLTAGLASPAQVEIAGESMLLRRRRQALARTFDVLSFSPAATLLWHNLDQRAARRLVELNREAAEMLGKPAGGAGGRRAQRPSLAPWQRGPARALGPDVVYETCAEIWMRSSLQIEHLAEGEGFEYFHFLQPNQYVPDSKPLSDVERRTAWAEDDPHRQHVIAGYPHLKAAGERLRSGGVAFHDLTGIFSDVREPLYVDTCCHLNRAGHDRLARAIGAVIVEQMREQPE